MHRSRPKSNIARHKNISFSQDTVGSGNGDPPAISNSQGVVLGSASGSQTTTSSAAGRRKRSRSNERTKEELAAAAATTVTAAAEFKQEAFDDDDEDDQECGELEIDEGVTQEEINEREKNKRRRKSEGTCVLAYATKVPHLFSTFFYFLKSNLEKSEKFEKKVKFSGKQSPLLLHFLRGEHVPTRKERKKENIKSGCHSLLGIRISYVGR